MFLCDVERGPRWLKPFLILRPFVAVGTDTGEHWKREEREGAVDAGKRRGGVMLGGNCSRGRTVGDTGEGWCRQDELIWSCRLVLRGKQKPSTTATFTDPTCDAVKSSILPFLAEKALLPLQPSVRVSDLSLPLTCNCTSCYPGNRKIRANLNVFATACMILPPLSNTGGAPDHWNYLGLVCTLKYPFILNSDTFFFTFN